MKPNVMTIHEAKTNLSRLIHKAARGQEVIISRGSKPVARLVPIGEIAGQRKPGSLKGKLAQAQADSIPILSNIEVVLDTYGVRRLVTKSRHGRQVWTPALPHADMPSDFARAKSGFQRRQQCPASVS